MKGGNRGLDVFLESMINDTRIMLLSDFIDSKNVFSSVDIKGGICYFLWNKNHKGKCNYKLYDVSNSVQSATRFLKTKGCDAFIRYPICVSILEKIQKLNEESFSKLVSFREPYGFATDFLAKPSKYGYPKLSNKPIDGGITFYGLENLKRIQKYAPKNYLIKRLQNSVGKFKNFVPKAYGCGAIGEVIPTPILGTPMSVCTGTFLRIGDFDTKMESKNALTYMKTKFFRLIVGIKKITQDCTCDKYSLVPVQDFTKPWTDKELYEKYGITEDEQKFIDSMIRPME